MKTCSKCKILKDLSEFPFRKDRGTYRNSCSACRDLFLISYREKNKDELRAKRAIRYSINKEEVLAEKAIYYQENKAEVVIKKRQYRLKNKERLSVDLKIRKLTDLNFRLRLQLRDRLNKAVKNAQKVGSAVDDLGCTIDQLKTYLEAKFQPGMTWDNWAKYGWHIDHIKSLCNFDLTDREQLRKACHYTNLQPLWWQDNLKKSKRTKHVIS